MLTKTIIENILLVAGESFWFFSAAAQLRHVRRTRDVRGLSAVTITLNAAANVAWMVYFSSRELWFPVGTNLLIFIVTVATLAYVLSNKRQFAKGIATIALVGPLTSLALISFPKAGGWIGMGYNWAASTPWLLRVVTKRKVTGISAHSLWLAWGAMTAVLSYGLLVHAMPLVVGCIQGMIYQAIITCYYYRYRKL